MASSTYSLLDYDDTEEAFIEEDGLPERPIPRLPRPAQPGARRNLADALEKRGFSRLAAEALARVPVDPTELRRSLEFPTHVSVPSGTLVMSTTRGWTPAIAPNLGNARLESRRVYPFAIPAGAGPHTKYPPLRDPVAAPGQSHELCLHVRDRDHVEWGLSLSRAFLKAQNDYEDDIATQGISLPVTVAACTFMHGDGSPPVAVAVASDGSSRVDSAHRVLHIDGGELLYEIARGDERAYRRAITTLYNQQAKGADFDPLQARMARALTTPVAVVVGFEPLDPARTDFAAAMAEYVAMFHLAPPEPWGDAAERGTKADAALAELVRDGLVDEVHRDYLSGLLSPSQARGAGYSKRPELHAADVIRVLSQPEHHISIRAGLRRLAVGKKRFQVRRRAKGEVAAELILRAAQGRLETDEIKPIRPTLSRTLEMADFYAPNWACTTRGPDTLRKLALAELEQGVEAGPAALELAARASMHLAENKVLRREAGGGTRLDESDFRDKRGPATVLAQLMRTEQGIQLLHRALVDGPDRRPILAVDETGAPLPEDGGGDQAADDLWVRRTWRPEGWTPDSRPRAPGDRFSGVVADFFTTVHQLARRLEAVQGVLDETDQPLVDQHGLPQADVRAAVHRLRTVSDTLTRYGIINEMQSPSTRRTDPAESP